MPRPPTQIIAALSALACGLGLAANARQSPKPPTPHDAKAASIRVAKAAPPALDKAAKPAAPPAKSPKPNTQQGNFESYDAEMDAATQITTARDFTFTTEQTKVTGQHGRWQGKDTAQILDANGNLVLDDPKHHVTGNKAHVEHLKRLAVITESVVILLKPDTTPPETPAAGVAATSTPDTGSAGKVGSERKHGVTIHCDRVDDYYRRQFIILRGHLVFTQQIARADGTMLERTLTAEHAEYNGKTNQLVLFAPVDASDSDGNKSHFEGDVTVGTKEGAETMKSKGKSTSSFPINSNTDDSDTATDTANPQK